MARPTPATNRARAKKGGCHLFRKGDIHLFRRRRLRGFTLGECLIASVLLSLTVLGVCGALSAASTQMDSMEVEAYCMSMAKQLAEEIAARSFDPPAVGDHAGWSGGNHQRAQYDNIADYNGLVEYIDPVSPASRVTDALEFSRSVSVQFRTSPTGAVNAAGDFAMITITVTPSARAEPFTLRRLVARTNIVR